MQLSPATKGQITRHLRDSAPLPLSTEQFRKLRTILQRDMPPEQAKHYAKRMARERGL